jgi:acetyl-CoA carboxylase biotin carboxyl carrier protein
MIDFDVEPTSNGHDPEFVRAVWEEARDLVTRLEGSSVQRLAVRAGAYTIEIERGAAAAPPAPVPVAAPAAVAQPAAAPAEAAVPEADDRIAIVAPLVGTFYRAPQPGAKAFVADGDIVEPGQTIGIVEAIMLMNHVQATERGRVVEIVAGDSEWVEFEQPLVYLEPVEAD